MDEALAAADQERARLELVALRLVAELAAGAEAHLAVEV